jgi:[acyl-carrier-protein] S-malonyltransferase
VGLAVLFPGQGTQHAATMPWLDGRPEAATTLQVLSASLDPAWRTRLGNAQWATANRHAQPLITGLSIAAWQCLADKLPTPAVVAGYSVGELAAFCAAGVFDAATALSLACDRADAMERAAAGHRMGLLAVHGLRPPMLERLCERHALSLAIRLCEDTAIVGGLSASLETAEGEITAIGARSTRLAIHVASHTPWMAAAATRFAQRLDDVTFAPQKAAIVCNFTASAIRNATDLRRCLAAQIASPVLWDACTDTMAERGVRCVLEVGPGTTLSSLWRSRHPHIPARSADDFRSPEAIAAWVHKTLASSCP